MYFGKNQDNNHAAWRVIGYDGNGVADAQGDMTLLAAGAMGVIPVSYTHLDVYKRQVSLPLHLAPFFA